MTINIKNLFYDEELNNNNESIAQYVKTANYDDEIRARLFSDKGLEEDYDYALNIVKDDGYNLKFLNEKLKDDEIIVGAAVNNYGESLEFASERLKDNFNIVKVAVSNGYPTSIRFSSEKLRDNSHMMNIVVNEMADCYCYASERLRKNLNFVLIAIKKDASLSYADDSIKDNEFNVMEILNNVQLTEDIWNNCSNRVRKMMGKVDTSEKAIKNIQTILLKKKLEENLPLKVNTDHKKLKL